MRTWVAACLALALSSTLLADAQQGDQAQQTVQLEIQTETARVGMTEPGFFTRQRYPIIVIKKLTISGPAALDASVQCLFVGRSKPQVVRIPGTCEDKGRALSRFQLDLGPRANDDYNARVTCQQVQQIGHIVSQGSMCGFDNGRMETVRVTLDALAKRPAHTIESGIATYSLRSPAGCALRIPVTPTTGVPRGESDWTGECANGLAEGPGEIRLFNFGVLINRTLTTVQSGLQEGASVSIDTDPKSQQNGFQTLHQSRGGYPFGKVVLLAPGGIVYAEGIADGRGGFRQTSNPASPLIQLLGQAMRGNRAYNAMGFFMALMAPDPAMQARNGADDCKQLMLALRHTQAAADEWCGGLLIWNPALPTPAVEFPGVAAAASPDQSAPVQVDQSNVSACPNDLRTMSGSTASFVCLCAPGLARGSVWGGGDGLYTSDSSICRAAVHAGAVTAESGGTVRVTPKPGVSSYQGSTKNGVTTRNYGSWEGSFVLEAVAG